MTSEDKADQRSFGGLIWVNITAQDLVRAEKFYSTVFNWMFLTSAIQADEEGKPVPNTIYFKFPMTQGKIPLMGGLVKSGTGNMQQIKDATDDSGDAALYMVVDNLEKVMKDVVAYGGTQASMVKPQGDGFLQHFVDTEGNYIGLYCGDSV